MPALPLFPLRQVLFPFASICLRIFELRYRRLLSQCLREKSNFGVVQIKSGSEVAFGKKAKLPQLFDVGTVAHILDVDMLADDTLGITVAGGRKFRLLRYDVAPNRLITGEVEYLPEEPPAEVPQELRSLAGVLQKIERDYLLKERPAGHKLDATDARYMGGVICQVLPFPRATKFKLLSREDPVQRLWTMHRLMQRCQ